jgi:hypothetical protein
MDSLREALEGQETGGAGAEQEGAGATPSDGPDAGPGESLEGEQGAPGAGSSSGEQSGEGGGAAPGEGAPAGDQAAPGAGSEAPAQPGSLESAGGGDSGLVPAGLGFSPDEKTGLATYLEVQLQLEATEARPVTAETAASGLPVEESTRQERSRLDFRNVPSELTPAQQELLNQERIPREYRNLIREYFQVIRPPVPQ